MFFPRLRNHVKWVYILLVLVFGLGFVFLGVGSGSSIGDLLQGNFNFGHSSSAGGSVSKAQARINKNPSDMGAYRDLARALESSGRTDEAIAALQHYSSFRPEDVGALRELAGLQLRKASDYQAQAQTVQYLEAVASSSAAFGAGATTSKLGKALGRDPVQQAVTTKYSSQLQDLYSKYTAAARGSVATYRQIATAAPTDPAGWFQLAQAAESAQETPAAIEAYKRFLKLAPDDPSAPQIRQRIKQLGATAPASASTSSGR